MPQVSSYPSNGQANRVNMNLGGRDYAAPKTNFVLSGGQVNKRD